MFLDEKIQSEQTELDSYLSTYTNDSLHLKMKEDFGEVLNNIEKIAAILNLQSGIEVSILSGYLIHGGYLSVTSMHTYQKGIIDIKRFLDDKVLYLALKIFSGKGSCRHSACFTKKVLDNFNIKNSIVSVDAVEKDYNINEIRLFLNNLHKNVSSHTNHVLNYISDNEINYLIDNNSMPPFIFQVYNQFASSIDGFSFEFPIYSYEYDLFSNEFIDYRKVPPLTEEEAAQLINMATATIKICWANQALFEEFYLHNKDIYQNINATYEKVYEKEKKLKLI